MTIRDLPRPIVNKARPAITRSSHLGGHPTSHTTKVMEMLAAGEAARYDVVASWDRCVTLHGLHPERDGHCDVLTSQELREARERLEPQLRLAEPDLLSLARQVARAGFFLNVTDINGTALMHRGIIPASSIREKVRDGMQWREDLQGTNAIGTGLFESRPTVITRDEHFYASNTMLTCMVAPLYDEHGQLFGAINIATDWASFDSTFSCVFMASLVATAQHIEARLFRRAYPGALIVSLPDSSGNDGSLPLVAIDGDMALLGATRAVRNAHRITPKMLESGMSIHQILPEVAVGPQSLSRAEETALRRALAEADGNISLAARQLGISRATMHRKIAAHAMNVGREGH